jgi:hypothetical protein
MLVDEEADPEHSDSMEHRIRRRYSHPILISSHSE